jgi:hypothetical protein
MPPAVSTQNGRVSASVAGRDLGRFSTKSGGVRSGESQRYRDPETRRERVLPGLTTVEDVTLSRPFDPDRDDLVFLNGQVMKGLCAISDQPTDADGNARGSAIVSKGYLVSVDGGETNLDDAGIRQLTLVFAIDETLA